MSSELEHVVTQELDAIGYDLVELRHGGTKSRPSLEVRIDRRDGEKVTVEDCAKASRALEARLDGGGLVSERYELQVSSPGERPLRTVADWQRFVGRWASVLAPEFGGRFDAEIISLDGEELVLKPDRGDAKRIPLAAIREARLTFRIS